MIFRLRTRLKCQKGFTLVELMVVIAILGVLASVAIPRFSNSTAKANTAKIAADLSTIDSAISMYQASTGHDPADIAALVTDGYLTAAPTAPTTAYYITGTGSVTPTTATYTFTVAASATATTANLRAQYDSNTSDHFH